MSRPCFRDHHRATAESTPPDSRTIARSIEGRLISGPALRIALRAADGTLPPHKYLSQTRVIQGPKRISGGGRRGQVVRLPDHPEFLLDPFEGLALPRREAVPVPVSEDGEEMSKAVNNVFRVTRPDEDRDDESALVAHHEPMVAEGDLVHLPVPFRERLADERRDRGDHAPDDIAVFVAHQAARHVLDQQAVRADHEDLFDHRLRGRWGERGRRWRVRHRWDALDRHLHLLRSELLRGNEMPDVR